MKFTKDPFNSPDMKKYAAIEHRLNRHFKKLHDKGFVNISIIADAKDFNGVITGINLDPNTPQLAHYSAILMAMGIRTLAKNLGVYVDDYVGDILKELNLQSIFEVSKP